MPTTILALPTAQTRITNRPKPITTLSAWTVTDERQTLLEAFGIGERAAATCVRVSGAAHSLNCQPINKNGVLRMDNNNENIKPRPQPNERRGKVPTAEQAFEMLESACGYVWANGFKIETMNDDATGILVIHIFGARRDVDAANKTRFTARAKPESGTG